MGSVVIVGFIDTKTDVATPIKTDKQLFITLWLFNMAMV